MTNSRAWLEKLIIVRNVTFYLATVQVDAI